MRPRRLLPLAAAVGAVLALTACTAAPEPGPSTAAPTSSPSAPATAPAPAPTPTGSTSAAEQRYLAFVPQFDSALAQRSPDDLLALGRLVCDGFRRGGDAAEVQSALGRQDVAPDLQATEGAVVLGASVATLCPQYRDRLADGAAG